MGKSHKRGQHLSKVLCQTEIGFRQQIIAKHKRLGVVGCQDNQKTKKCHDFLSSLFFPSQALLFNSPPSPCPNMLVNLNLIIQCNLTGRYNVLQIAQISAAVRSSERLFVYFCQNSTYRWAWNHINNNNQNHERAPTLCHPPLSPHKKKKTHASGT